MHAAKIDQMLNACGSQLFVEDLADDDHPLSSQRSRIDLDLPALVAMTARTPNTIPGSPSTLQTASRSQLNPHLHLVPTRIEDIRPDIPITREDIEQVGTFRPFPMLMDADDEKDRFYFTLYRLFSVLRVAGA